MKQIGGARAGGRHQIIVRSAVLLAALLVPALAAFAMNEALSSTLSPRIRRGFLAAAIDKRARAQNTVGRARILVVGGSSAAFGVDSKMIEQTVGRPVVNLGLHGAAGALYILNVAMVEARPNDVVVLQLEYSVGSPSFQVLSYLDALVPQWSTKGDLSLLDQIRLDQISGRIAFERLVSTESAPARYRRSMFDDRGDVIPRDPNLTSFRSPGIPLLGGQAPLQRYVGRICRTVSRLEERGVEVVVSLPPFPRSQPTSDRKAIGRYVRSLEQCLPSAVPVLHSASSVTYADQFFDDTAYHLNARGRELFSRALVAELMRQTDPVVG